MAIVKMSNFSLFAFDSKREDLLHKLQEFKYVHFSDIEMDDSLKEIGLQDVKVPESLVAIDEDISKVKYGMDLLNKYYTRETGLKAMSKGLETFEFKELEEKALKIDYHSIYNQLKELNTKKEILRQEISKLNTSINELNPWIKLESPISKLDAFSKSEIILGTVPKKLVQKLQEELTDTKYTYFEVLSEGVEDIYILAITSIEEEDLLKDILRNNGFSRVKLSGEKTPSEEIKEYEGKVNRLQNDITIQENEIKSLAKHLPELEVEYEYLLNKKLRFAASEKFVKTDNVTVIKGYIPTDMKNEFTDAIKGTLNDYYYLEVEEADKDDADAPILLKNSKFVQSFQSLTGMYALPNYNEIDPTPLLAPFYLIFFGMMVADFGYGLIMLIGTLIALKKFNLSESQRDSIRFFYYLSYATIFWGLVFGSFLGGIIPIPGLMNPATQYNELLVISIIFGIVHLFFALGIKAYLLIRDGQPLAALFDVGFWYMALTGGIVYIIGIVMTIPPILKTIGFAVMVIGMVGIILTGGREANSIGGKAAGGLYSLYGISSYVGDFVSYSRLMALGLSGGFIASAINMMVDMLVGKGIIGILFGIVVFLVGQAFNIFLSLLGAYVHTIRLTYVEFFGKFYSGGGKEFKQFRNKPKYINIK